MKIIKRFIPLVKGVDLSQRRIPLVVIDSQNKGPIVWLAAAIHGDEVTGTAIIHSILKQFQKEILLKGKIYCFPIMNPTGFETISRKEQYGEADLNRNFGGKLAGSTAERHAALLSETIIKTHPDYVIDLHADSMNSIAYTIVDVPQNKNRFTIFEKCRQLADMLCFPWATDTERSAGYPIEKSLSGYLVKNQVVAVTVELGAPLVVVESFRKKGVEAIWRFLQYIKMVKGEFDFTSRKKQPLFIFQEKIRTQSTGIIEYQVEAGAKIKKGQMLGKIKNVFGETIEVIKSPEEGILFSHADQSITFPGQDLFTLVTPTTLDKI